MPDALTVAGVLLVVGPLVGLVPVAYPPFLPIWSATRERHITVVAGHRRAWFLLNAGFAFATVATAAGLAVLPGALDGNAARSSLLVAVAVTYTIAGAAWCAVVAIRARTTPAISDLGAVDAAPGPAEVLLGAATGGLFAAFVLGTAAATILLGLVLLAAGGVAAPAAGTAVVVGAIAIALQIRSGDFIPAVVYLPTLVLGVALLGGWT